MSDQNGNRRSRFSAFADRPSDSFEDDVDKAYEEMNMDTDRGDFLPDDGRSSAGGRFPFFGNVPRFGTGFGGQGPHGFLSPRSFSERFSDMGDFPSDLKENGGGGKRGFTPERNVCGTSGAFERGANMVPIPVVHSKPKHRYDGDAPRSNTAHLGAARQQGGGGGSNDETGAAPHLQQPSSPRLGRAQSEPPPNNSQSGGHRVRAAANWQPYNTIQEAAEEQSPGSNPSQSPFSSSVPSRRVPFDATAATPQGFQSSTSPSAATAVRRIPIFVEGRDDPVLGGKKQQHHEHSNPSSAGASGAEVPSKRLQLDVGQKPPAGEPTSPLSPPTGPIPMGYVSSNERADEQDGSKVPIPMPCSADLMRQNGNPSQQQQQASGEDDDAASAVGSKVDPALKMLQNVRDAVTELSERIGGFDGSKTDKEYLYLDEMLTRHLLTLDGIDAAGRDDIRQMRKETIKLVNQCLGSLESKIASRDESNSQASVTDEAAVSSGTNG